ncbi:MAG: bifunctional folylpolyglutamate synthase/dihydrofolate synthase [Clostridiales Family XIII bacterium]|jgi:dihydrofolate synthase/folylpolyglutamate synthase|nr:bifunctional folylpolyglutamate synthase/dihydrofolate synthase [Clostridiales Family XIII bacterium]
MTKTENPVELIHRFERFGSKLGLERISALMARLGDPQDGMRVIHVAGTNGKGSVCRYIYSVLRRHGIKAGLYTSPFVVDFFERIEFDGKRITEEELAECTREVMERVDAMLAEGAESPTEFEVLTAVAFLYFSKNGTEFLVLEVGLGGRGDSTNVVKRPELCVISSISLDHTDRLGSTLPEIAREKAGIIKPGCPVIVNVADAEAAKVIAGVAYERGAPLIDAHRIEARGVRKSPRGYAFNASIMGKHYSDIRVSMPGMHQVENAICALCAIELLRGKALLATDGVLLREGMEEARQPGRFEVLPGEPTVVLDGAHNPAGAEAMAETALELFPGKRILLVAGVLRDKALSPMIDCFDRVADAYIATEPRNERRLPAAELCAALERTGKPVAAVADPARAMEEAWRRRGDFDVIVVSGSLYLLGAVREDVYEKTRQGSAVL